MVAPQVGDRVVPTVLSGITIIERPPVFGVVRNVTTDLNVVWEDGSTFDLSGATETLAVSIVDEPPAAALPYYGKVVKVGYVGVLPGGGRFAQEFIGQVARMFTAEEAVVSNPAQRGFALIKLLGRGGNEANPGWYVADVGFDFSGLAAQLFIQNDNKYPRY